MFSKETVVMLSFSTAMRNCKFFYYEGFGPAETDASLVQKAFASVFFTSKFCISGFCQIFFWVVFF